MAVPRGGVGFVLYTSLQRTQAEADGLSFYCGDMRKNDIYELIFSDGEVRSLFTKIDETGRCVPESIEAVLERSPCIRDGLEDARAAMQSITRNNPSHTYSFQTLLYSRIGQTHYVDSWKDWVLQFVTFSAARAENLSCDLGVRLEVMDKETDQPVNVLTFGGSALRPHPHP